ncbi:MAG TPA: tetratricopeptide repeat protein [Candidatus Margulisiibacteriota bacterium]|nr:tetratricopeptide repeat protein [Candidatus Margulisiibacteriota bacterium]
MNRRIAHDTPPAAAVIAGRYGLPLLIVVLVSVCFSPVVDNDFINLDDPYYFTSNVEYRGLSLSHLRWMFTTLAFSHYQPLSWLSHGIVFSLWGLSPAAFHVGNLVLHAVNAVVLYFVGIALLRHKSPAATPSLALYGSAALGALFFALHPLRVEAVAWATERQEVLCGVFFLLALLAYLRMVEARRAGAPWLSWYLGSIVCFACSLLSKAAGLMLPLVLLVLDVYPLGRFAAAGNTRRAQTLVEKIPYVALALGATATAFFAKGAEAMVTLAEHGRLARTVQALYGLCFYLWKTVAPFGLSPLYRLHSPLNVAEPRFVASAVVAIAITVCVVSLRRRCPWALASWTCYVLLLAPVLGIVQAGPQLAADRYTYLACLPWAVLVAAGTHHLWHAADEGRRGVVASSLALAALVLGLGLRTWQQTRVWRDSQTVWDQALRIDPGNDFAYTNRADARRAKGDLDGALADCTEALRLNPEQIEAYKNCGTIRQLRGDLAGALHDFERLIQVGRRHNDAVTLAEAYIDHGKALQAQGDIEAAIADYDAAIRFEPRQHKAYNNRGNARFARGDLDGALADLSLALQLDPGYATAYNNRGNVLQARGERDAAIADFTQALRADPGYADAYFNRANARKATGDLDGAIADYSEALRLKPRYVSAYMNRGNARKARGDLAGALADYDAVLRLNPQHANAQASRAAVRVALEGGGNK